MPPKRRQISIETKLKIVRRWRSGESLNSVSNLTGYDRRCLRNWVKNESKLVATVKKQARKRLSGAGVKPFFPEIEEHLLNWFRSERTEKRQVSYELIREEAKEISISLGLDAVNFPCSNKWIQNFCRRNNIGNRKVTHRGQEDNRSPSEVRNIVSEYLTVASHKIAGISEECIFNMDETPCYFDMASDHSLHFRGERNIDGVDTGHRKSRFTVILCISAHGKIIKPLIIFKGLKKVPQVPPRKDVVLTVSKGGSTNMSVMEKWIQTCFASRGHYLSSTKSILFMDCFGTHKKEEILSSLKRVCNTEAIFIPPRTTHFLQPLDVCVNASFKAALKSKWQSWLRTGPKLYTVSAKATGNVRATQSLSTW